MDGGGNNVANRTRAGLIKRYLNKIGKRPEEYSGVSVHKFNGVPSDVVVIEDDDEDLSGVRAKPRKGWKRGGGNVVNKRKFKKSNRGRNSEMDDFKVICEVSTSSLQQTVRIGEAEYVIEKNKDVLKFVEEKKYKVGDGIFGLKDVGRDRGDWSGLQSAYECWEEAADDMVKSEEDGSDIKIISDDEGMIDAGEDEARKGGRERDGIRNEGEKEVETVKENVEDKVLDEKLEFDALSSEDNDSDYEDGLSSDCKILDESSSYADSVDEDIGEVADSKQDDCVDDDEEYRPVKKNGIKHKGNEKIVEGVPKGRKNDKRKQKIDSRLKRNEKIVEGVPKGRKNDKRKQKIDSRLKRNIHSFELEERNSCDDWGKGIGEKDSYELKKKTESQGVAGGFPSTSGNKSGMEKVSAENTFQPPKDVEVVKFGSSSETDDDDEGGSGGEYVYQDVRESGRYPTVRLNAKRVGQILANSLLGTGEGRPNMADASKGTESLKKESIYRFSFGYKDRKQVEKSEFEKEIDALFEEMDKILAFEHIGSTSSEVDNGATSGTQTNVGIRCSQGIHEIIHEEQVGYVCKYCSHVELEAKYILPTLIKPSPRRRGKSFSAQTERPYFPESFQDKDIKDYSVEDYNSLGTVWDLIPGIRNSMYEHQREGFEFMWNNLAGGINIEKLDKPLPSLGSGCIISHAPGTGKTRLTIVFIQSYMKLYPNTRPMIVAPKSLLLTWEGEMKKWNVGIPFHNMNNPELSGQENADAMNLSKDGRCSKNNKSITRIIKLFSWKQDKSILGITYGLFEKIVGAARRDSNCNPIEQKMGEALVKLPSLLVLDEGHIPRNNKSYVYQALCNVDTEKRIILSGTPFQNNFSELYNTLCLANPKFGTSSTCDHVLNKMQREKEFKSKWNSMTNFRDDSGHVVGHKLRELKDMIGRLVHVHKGTILQKNCPGLKDAAIRLHPTELQQELITILEPKENNDTFSHVMSMVCVHPSLLPERLFQEPQFSVYRDRLELLKKDPYSGAKTKFVMEICRLSEALNEKVLIFGQYIDPLIFIKEHLQSHYNWTEGREVLYMDGSLEPKLRQTSINALNDPNSNVRVLLASTKACCEGIHLVGASRVVLLDVVWNPSVERQAISRAYRLGQKKMVYTYHLIAGKMEVEKYKHQVGKEQLSEMVFAFNDNKDCCKERLPDMISEDTILHEMFTRNEKLGGMFEQIVYQPKDAKLVDTFDLVAPI